MHARTPWQSMGRDMLKNIFKKNSNAKADALDSLRANVMLADEKLNIT
jgi:hypothetical protein